MYESTQYNSVLQVLCCSATLFSFACRSAYSFNADELCLCFWYSQYTGTGQLGNGIGRLPGPVA